MRDLLKAFVMLIFGMSCAYCVFVSYDALFAQSEPTNLSAYDLHLRISALEASTDSLRNRIIVVNAHADSLALRIETLEDGIAAISDAVYRRRSFHQWDRGE